MLSQGEAVVLGEPLFIDLWSLVGLEPVLCQDPDDLLSLLPALLERRDLICVVVDEGWFARLAPELRSRLETMELPLWLPLPELDMQEVAG
ncbi:MAG: hypothetical protein CSA35_03110 [Dethiosulfovibrio peptidovorans]|nr:MAG: hypothetical protein CSA35_03110 [Dethiosulfovibrio peptidovorans]